MKAMMSLLVFIIFTIVSVAQTPTHEFVDSWSKINLSNAMNIVPAYYLELSNNPQQKDLYLYDMKHIPDTSYLFVVYRDSTSPQENIPIWQVWDFQTSELIFEQNNDVYDSVLSPDGAYLGILIEGGPDQSDSICLWSVENLQTEACWDSFYTSNLSFSPDGSLFLFNQKINNTEDTPVNLIIWDIKQEEEFSHINNVIGWKFNPINPQELMTYAQNIILWDISATPQERYNYQLNPEELVYGIFSNVTFNISGEYLYFMTLNFKEAKQQFNILEISSQEIIRIDREDTRPNFFQRPNANIFAFGVKIG